MKMSIVIKSEIENLRTVEKFVDEISEELQLSNEIYGNVLIATLEADNNAIIHGNKQNKELDVFIDTKKDDSGLHMIIKDQGPGFDYNNIPDPTAPENLEKINGRGIFLMEKLSDKIEFKQNGSHVYLTFNA
jgi:serine/threonine-protein kinase RsbW